MVKTILPLHIDGAVVRRRTKTLIGPVTATIKPNGFTIIMGPNGSGKTSLLRLMHGLESPREGQLTWQVPVTEAAARQSFVFQTPVTMRRSVQENMAYPLLVRGVPKTAALDEAALWLSQIDLLSAKNLDANLLSGGEKQKLAIARALITKPEVLFLDEPTTNLDGSSTREIETILIEAKKSGTRIIMATHDTGQGKRLANDVIFLYRGTLRETNSSKVFFRKPKTREAAAFLKGEIVE